MDEIRVAPVSAHSCFPPSHFPSPTLMPLNLLYDARPLTDPNSGGVRRVAGMILEAILASDLDVTVACVTTGIKKPALPEPFASHPRITHTHIRIPNKIWSLLAMMGVVSLDRIAKGQGKRVMDQGSDSLTPDPCPLTHVALLPNLGFTGFIEIPYALVLHDLSFLIEPRWFPWKTRFWHIAVNPKETARRAEIIFCVSETTARDAERLLTIPREKIRVFAPGIPSLTVQGSGVRGQGSDSLTHDPCPLTQPYVLAFDKGDSRKNAATAIAAVEILRRDDAFKNMQLVLVGSATPSASNEAIKQSNNEAMEPWSDQNILRSVRTSGGAAIKQSNHHASDDVLIRVPRPSDAELASLYQHASAFLYPSWYEGYGLPLHEAARYGTPCIASTMGALPETAPQGTIFAPPSKPHLWASMIRDVLAAPDRYRTTFDESIVKTDVSDIVEWVKRVG